MTSDGPFLDETDFQSENMVKVFENPEKYLQGPLAEHYGKQENWVVVGAGIAGLMSASMLLRIGHKVKFFLVFIQMLYLKDIPNYIFRLLY